MNTNKTISFVELRLGVSVETGSCEISKLVLNDFDIIDPNSTITILALPGETTDILVIIPGTPQDMTGKIVVEVNDNEITDPDAIRFFTEFGKDKIAFLESEGRYYQVEVI